MKKFFLFPLFAITLLLVVLFYPHKVEQGIVVSSTDTSISIMVGENIKHFKIFNITCPNFTVVNFTYNHFLSYNFEAIAPITDRIITKDDKLIDLESIGPMPLTNQSHYYQLDTKNNLTPINGKNIVVGQKNTRCYKDKKGTIQTVIVPPVDYSCMRVGISTTNFSSLQHSKVELSLSSPSTLFCLAEKTSIALPKESLVTIEKESAALKVIYNGTFKIFKDRIYIKGNSIALTSTLRGTPSFVPIYSGILEFKSLDKGISVINEISLEEYLTKVVPSEMPTTGGIEALKCQAIAARTYAISDMLKCQYSPLGFYVDDSSQSQVYNNAQPKELTSEAVNATKGLILTYSGAPIDAKYYSTSSGTSANYADIWLEGTEKQAAPPYLKATNLLTPKTKLPSSEEEWLTFYKDKEISALDSFAPYFRWQIELPNSAITKSINTSLKTMFLQKKEYISLRKDGVELHNLEGLKDLKDIYIIKRSEQGNIIEISFAFANATLNIKSDYVIRSVLKCNEENMGIKTTLLRHIGDPVINSTFLPSSFFAIEKKDGVFKIYGGGYGHGVGMSQNAAIQLSKNGENYTDILNTFYRDIKIEKTY